MIICICHRVSDRDIAHAARQGCNSFDDLQLELGVATACGKCHDCAHQTFALHRVLQGRTETLADAGATATVGQPRALPRRETTVQVQA